jgi:simple sugar transport system ATP-binding protein
MSTNVLSDSGTNRRQDRDTILEMRNITKTFPGVVANDSVDLGVQRGEIHALLGENGAGKSTLMKILYGLYTQDEGQIRLNGERVHIDSPQEAIEAGISMVHQHFMLIHRLTPVENIVLGSRETPFSEGSVLGRLYDIGPLRPLISGLTMDLEGPRRKIAALVEEYGMELDLDKQIWELDVGERQRVEILKALYEDADILILDEPTAVLSPGESEKLFETLDRLKAEGMSVILITHKLHEVVANADRTTVLREGEVVDCVDVDDITESDLAEMMVGREVLFQLDREDTATGDTVAEVNGVCAVDDRGIQALNQVDIEIREGEIVGVAGVSGNGQRELAECLAGIRDVTAGTISIGGTELTGAPPRSFIEANVSYIPEDRNEVGSAPERSITNNAIMKNYREFAGAGSFDREQARAYAQTLVEEFDIRAPNVETPVNKLSGGNLQKLICAREFSQDPDFLIANQPTRGIDVGAIEYIRTVLLEQRKEGTGILLLSEDLDEIFQLSDRIVAIYDGEIVHRTPTEEAKREHIGQYIAGGESTASREAYTDEPSGENGGSD